MSRTGNSLLPMVSSIREGTCKVEIKRDQLADACHAIAIWVACSERCKSPLAQNTVSKRQQPTCCLLPLPCWSDKTKAAGMSADCYEAHCSICMLTGCECTFCKLSTSSHTVPSGFVSHGFSLNMVMHSAAHLKLLYRLS